MRSAIARSLLVIAALLARPAHAQPGGIAGRIVSTTGDPLAYGIVALPASDLELFTTDSGTFVLTGLRAGRHELNIRRLGFRPVTIAVDVRSGVIDTVRVPLERLAVELDRVTVRAWPPCRTPGPPRPDDDPTLAAVFQQVRLNAEQFRLLSRSYPYAYRMARTLTNRMRETGKLSLFWHSIDEYRSNDRWQYRPGEVIARRGRRAAFRIPTIAELTDERFLGAHCFHYAGLDKVDSVDMVRVDLVASEDIRTPDVNGSMYLDPQTFQIRRTVLSLSRRDRNLEHLLDMRVTTDFGEYLPSIPVIVQVHSVQVIDPQVKSDIDEAYEEQELVEFRFTKRKPGGQ